MNRLIRIFLLAFILFYFHKCEACGEDCPGDCENKCKEKRDNLIVLFQKQINAWIEVKFAIKWRKIVRISSSENACDVLAQKHVEVKIGVWIWWKWIFLNSLRWFIEQWGGGSIHNHIFNIAKHKWHRNGGEMHWN